MSTHNYVVVSNFLTSKLILAFYITYVAMCSYVQAYHGVNANMHGYFSSVCSLSLFSCDDS